MSLSALSADALSGLAGIRHGFLTRQGGVSNGIYASLNCGSGSKDDRQAVQENRRRAAAYFAVPAGALNSLHQIHSAEAVIVERPWGSDGQPRADAMATRSAGLALAILSADCAPVLFADGEAGVVAAAHAGWRGALSGVLAAALEAMASLGARRDRVRAAVGPCIVQASYEVGPEFAERFLAQDPNHTRFFEAGARAGHHLFDLPGFVAAQLHLMGLAAVENLALDTYADAARFFSYRRASHAGEKDYGRMLSAIALSET